MLSRRSVGILSLLAGAVGWCGLAQAQPVPFPSKPIRLVVPNAAGGAADLTARTVGQKMAESLGQPVVVDNKPGAGGVVAGELVAKAAADGHTLLLISSGTAVSASLFKTLPFDTLKDFIPVAPLATFDLVIVGLEGGRFRTLGDVLSWARSNPGKLNIGTPNIGTTQHLAAEWFKSAAGVDAQIVPFNGTPAVINALRGGQIDIALDILSPLLPQIKGQVLHPLAVTGAKRSRVLPEAPTARESGVTQFAASSWNGLAVPARTPREVVMRLNRDINAALQDPAVKKRLEDLNLDPHPGSPDLAAEWLSSDIQRWSSVIQRAGIARQ